MRRTRAAVPHSARTRAALLSGEERGRRRRRREGVRVVDEINAGVADIAVDGEREPRRRKQDRCWLHSEQNYIYIWPRCLAWEFPYHRISICLYWEGRLPNMYVRSSMMMA